MTNEQHLCFHLIQTFLLIVDYIILIILSVQFNQSNKTILHRVRYYTDTDEMYPDMLTPKGRKAVRKMKRFIKKHKITSKADINLIYGFAEIEKGKKK